MLFFKLMLPVISGVTKIKFKNKMSFQVLKKKKKKKKEKKKKENQ